MATWPSSRRRARFDLRRALALGLLCATVLVGGLLVLAVVRAVQSADSAGGDEAPAEQRADDTQRARDREAGLSYRVTDTTVTVIAKRRSSVLGDLRGRRLVVQCAFLTVDGAVFAQGKARWPRDSRRVSVTLDARPGRDAQFCELSRRSSGAAISRAVF